MIINKINKTHKGYVMEKRAREEINRLRFPFFALVTKGLETHPPIEVSGLIQEGEERVQWSLTVDKPSMWPWPGPESRAVHLALVSGKPLPLTNPLTWMWRDLCRRMDRDYSGKTARELKEAIRATAGLTIVSKSALYDSANKRRIHSEEITHLYDRVVFKGEEQDDGTIAERNEVWLSDWYLRNWNAKYTAPIDFDIWQLLHKRSPIASRLYEYLLYGNRHPELAIRYTVLATLLPVRVHSYLSKAKQQLDLPFTELMKASVVANVEWKPREDCLAELRIVRGPRIRGEDRTPEKVQTEQVSEKDRLISTPAEELLVRCWYKTVRGNDQVPTQADLKLAGKVIEQYGVEPAGRLINLFAQITKMKWAKCKSFKAAADKGYFADAEADRKREEDRKRKNQEDRERRDNEAAVAQRDRVRWQWWMWRFSRADHEAQEEVKRRVRERHGNNMPNCFLEQLCLEEISTQTKKLVERYLAETGRAGRQVREIVLIGSPPKQNS